MKVICDSTTLIGLAKVGKVDILEKLFSEVYIPEAVYDEVVVEGKGKPGAKEIENADWIHCKKVQDQIDVEMLAGHIDRGEAEVLVLGKEMRVDWLIIDEDKARNSAFAAGFNVIGLVGLLVVAKRLEHIQDVKSILDELRVKRFYIDDEVYMMGLKASGEL